MLTAEKLTTSKRFFRVIKVSIQIAVTEIVVSTIYLINHFPVDKYYENQLRYPLVRGLSRKKVERYPPLKQLGRGIRFSNVPITVTIL